MDLRIALVYMLTILSLSFANNAHARCENKLTLEKIYQLLKENHPDLKAALIETDLAKSRLLESQGVFDPSLRLSHGYKRYNSSSDISRPQNANLSEASISLLTRYGAKLTIGGERNYGDIKTPISPTGDDGDYFASLKIPFLRGGGFNDSNISEIKNKIEITRAINDFRLTELSLLLSSSEAYYKWLATIELIRIENSLRDLAQFRTRSINALSKSGDMASIDVAEALQELERRNERVFNASRTERTAAFDLSWYVWNIGENEPHIPLQCEADQPTLEMKPINLNDSQKLKIEALKIRPEVKDINLSKTIAKLSQDLAINKLYPVLDGYLKAGRQFGNNAMPGISGEAGIEFTLPIYRREAKGALSQAKNEMIKLSFVEKSMIAKVFIQIDKAVASINYLVKQNDAAKNELIYAKKIEEGEREKFKHGDSTLFILNRRERATAEAKIKLTMLNRDYLIAKTYLKAVVGTLS